MKRLPLAFFSAAALCVTTGMAWGIYMGSKQDFTLAPAHAHLNLVGWASLALMGTFYALSGKGGRLGWLNFILSSGAVVVMIPFLAVMLGGKPTAEPGVIAGSILAILGMLTFLFNVLSTWREVEAA
ncbi:hypothetical protein [Phenylobacterium sp.]|uniref:hypothetical protein n=1 Tax=Phenylobacterium sp. TaxID=1871053 RepID=UPI0035676C37